MSQTPLSSDLGRFTVRDERARTTLQLLSQTAAMTVMWVVTWKWLAPMLGVRVLNPIELFQTLSAAVVPAVLAGGSASASLSVAELMLGAAIWTFPIIVGVFGIATISAALWYVVGRLIDPPAATDAGGEA
jgi:hypothetical protein